MSYQYDIIFVSDKEIINANFLSLNDFCKIMKKGFVDVSFIDIQKCNKKYSKHYDLKYSLRYIDIMGVTFLSFDDFESVIDYLSKISKNQIKYLSMRVCFVTKETNNEGFKKLEINDLVNDSTGFVVCDDDNKKFNISNYKTMDDVLVYLNKISDQANFINVFLNSDDSHIYGYMSYRDEDGYYMNIPVDAPKIIIDEIMLLSDSTDMINFHQSITH